MCQIKLLEVRDHHTFLSVMATRLGGRTPKEIWLLNRGGFGKTIERQEEFVILTTLDPDCRSSYDPYKWPGGRTLRLAHAYIRDNWDKLISGDLIDIEHLEEETTTPKTSEFDE